MAEYNNFEKHQNYLRIKRHIELLNTRTFTEDILEEYMQYLKEIRDVFSDMSYIHPEIKNPIFRACAAKCEYHLSNLTRKDSQFDPYAYIEFLHSILYMADYCGETDSLADLFDSMSVR